MAVTPLIQAPSAPLIPAEPNNTVVCALCPKGCRLAPGAMGDCQGRANKGGVIVPLAWGRPCAVALDPIEKKPLFHFYPGSLILSLGLAGCNLHCRNCQNSAISQHGPLTPGMTTQPLPPEAVTPLMRRHGVHSVAYTYTEPLIAFEYVLACARLVRESGGKNVLVSAGYVRPEPLARLLPFIDAANIDLKSMRDAFYRSNCKARLPPVLNALKAFRAAGVSLEVTNLVIPTLNDSDADVLALIHFVRDELGNETPLHFSRFFPTHLLRNLPPTPESVLYRARELALTQGLRHVYAGNVRREPEITRCAQCQKTLIVRDGYVVTAYRVNADGTCPVCSTPLYGCY